MACPAPDGLVRVDSLGLFDASGGSFDSLMAQEIRNWGAEGAVWGGQGGAWGVGLGVGVVAEAGDGTDATDAAAQRCLDATHDQRTCLLCTPAPMEGEEGALWRV